MAWKPGRWPVLLDANALVDLEQVRSKGDRRAVLNAIEKLSSLGPDLPPPHMKSLRGHPDLGELRPRQGASEVRPLYARIGDRFVILAVAAKKSEFDRAVENARERMRSHAT